MAAYYQIAGAAERSVSQPLVSSPCWQRWPLGRTWVRAQAHSGNANSTKCKPSSGPGATKLKPRERACHLQRAGANLAPPAGGAFLYSIRSQSLRVHARERAISIDLNTVW